jgi:hypothetical protein
MKSIYKIKMIMGTALIGAALTGCLKPNKNSYTDFSTTTDKVMILNAGLAGASKSPASIVVAGSTDSVLEVEIDVQMASKNTNTESITVTLAVDDAKRGPYNTQDKLKVGFDALPDSCYSFPNKTVSIVPGTNFGKAKLYVYPTKVDITKSYMLPISIINGGGKDLTTNSNTQYFNMIGNELAGSYLWTFSRYNSGDSLSGFSAGSSWVDDPGLILPVTPTTITMPSGYYIQPRYEITYDKTGGVYSNFKVTLNEADVKTMADNGVTVTDGPYLWIADPVAKRFLLNYTVFNGSANRYLVDEYHQ